MPPVRGQYRTKDGSPGQRTQSYVSTITKSVLHGERKYQPMGSRMVSCDVKLTLSRMAWMHATESRVQAVEPEHSVQEKSVAQSFAQVSTGFFEQKPLT